MNGNREFASMLVKTISAKGHFSGFGRQTRTTEPIKEGTIWQNNRTS